jgi:hypothetical protein
LNDGPTSQRKVNRGSGIRLVGRWDRIGTGLVCSLVRLASINTSSFDALAELQAATPNLVAELVVRSFYGRSIGP